MRIERISLKLIGDNFSPQMLVENMKSDCIISLHHEPMDKRDDNELEPFGYGYLSLENPMGICIEDDIEQYESWFVEFLEINHEFIKLSGADEIQLFIEMFYSKQCNFEILSRENLSRLAKFNVAIPISVYQLSDSQLEELLKENGFSEEKIKDLNIEDN